VFIALLYERTSKITTKTKENVYFLWFFSVEITFFEEHLSGREFTNWLLVLSESQSGANR